MSGVEVEMTSSLKSTDFVTDSASVCHSRSITSIVRPYQPVLSDEESDIYDDNTWEESSVIDDADWHRIVKPPIGDVYK